MTNEELHQHIQAIREALNAGVVIVDNAAFGPVEQICITKNERDGAGIKIKPTAPPKLREWYLSDADLQTEPYDKAHDGLPQRIDVYRRTDKFNRDKMPDLYIRVREVSETADAEIAELRRNHDALCRAITEYFNGTGVCPPTLLECMTRHEANL